ncbi:MAG: hypothetical protein A2147_09880 [Chloroflexi bacterium RBG_16_57_8]|nr:MAG: hypothetical protein A2147_09880 [Chloroflexi bacterium RBG_16_57_8]
MAIFQKTSFGPIYPQANDVNPVGISHKVWVDLTAIAGEPTAPTLGGIPVRFVIEGPNAGASGVAYTDDAGRATFEYYGNEGMDRIWAYIDGDGDQVRDSNEPRSSNTALKFWVRHFVTGGGNIKDGKKVTWTFSGAVGVLPEGGAVGSFQIVDQSTKEVYSVDEFVVLSFYGSEAGSPTATHNTARFRGVGTRSSDGARVEVVIILEDNGEPGKDADKIAAEVARVGAGPNNVNVIPLIGNVYVPERYPPPPAPPTTPPPSELVTISGGNIQVHNMPNP